MEKDILSSVLDTAGLTTGGHGPLAYRNILAIQEAKMV